MHRKRQDTEGQSEKDRENRSRRPTQRHTAQMSAGIWQSEETGKVSDPEGENCRDWDRTTGRE